MKKFFILIAFLLLSISSYSQEAARGEIFINITDAPSTYSFSVEVSSDKAYWYTDDDKNGIHDTCMTYDGDSLGFSSPLDLVGIDLDYDPDGAFFIAGAGIYKIELTYSGTTNYILFDTRTSALPECAALGSPDINFDYHLRAGKWTVHLDTTNINGTTQFFWELVSLEDCTTQVTTKLVPHPAENLTKSYQSGFRRVDWDSSSVQDEWCTGYDVFRRWNAGSWDSIYTTPLRFYIDQTTPPKGTESASYKIRARNGDAVSFAFSNIVVFGIDDPQGGGNDKLAAGINGKSLVYELMQNYPNPFNPITNISFTSKEKGFVSLKVFDILGKEVDTIVEKVLPSGNHTVQFDGSRLESGIYIYEINISGFRDSKKLAIIK